MLTLGSGAYSSSMKIECAGRSSATGELRKKGLRVRAGGREHRTAPARRQASPQRGLVGGRETASEVMSIAEIITGRARKHRRTQRSSPQRSSSPIKRCCVASGQERGW